MKLSAFVRASVTLKDVERETNTWKELNVRKEEI